MPLLRFAIFACIAFLVGCTTYQSTIVEKAETPGAWYKQPKVDGLPVSTPVLTHVRLDLTRTTYLVGAADKDGIKVETVGWLEKNGEPLESYSVNVTPIHTNTLVFVDPKRPLSGGLKEGNFTFKDDSQRLSQIDYQADDNTIEDITTIVESFFPNGLIPATPLGAPTSALDKPQAAAIDSLMQPVTSVVRTEVIAVTSGRFGSDLKMILEGFANLGQQAR